MKKLRERIGNKLGEKRYAQMEKVLRILRVIKNVACWVVIAILAAAVVIFTLTKFSGGTPTVFGYSVHRVLSGSMEPELSIGDVIVGKNIEDPSQLHIGDIVTFRGGARFDNKKVTHRVIVAPYDDGKGNLMIVTQGDANSQDDGEINLSAVESKFQFKLTFLSKVYNFFFSPWGLVVFIFLLLLIFFDEIIRLLRLITGSVAEEEPETVYDMVERVQKEKQEEIEREKLLKKEARRKKAEKHNKKFFKKKSKKKDSNDNLTYYGKKKKKKSKKRKKRK